MTENERKQIRSHIDFVKRAFRQKELMEQMPSVDDEWKRFALDHQAELDVIESEEQWHKIAASFIGFLFIAGIAFAAIRNYIEHSTSNIEHSPTEFPKAAANNVQSTTFNVPSDTIPAKPRVFENMPLKDIVAELAQYYHAEYEVANAEAAQLRLYYPWNPQMSLQHVIDELNRFENVNLKLNGQRISIE